MIILFSVYFITCISQFTPHFINMGILETFLLILKPWIFIYLYWDICNGLYQFNHRTVIIESDEFSPFNGSWTWWYRKSIILFSKCLIQIKKTLNHMAKFEKINITYHISPFSLAINIFSMSSLSLLHSLKSDNWDKTLTYSNIHSSIILTTNNLVKSCNDSSINFDNDQLWQWYYINIWFCFQYWLNMMLLRCIVFVIDINIINIGIWWHTSYTTLLWKFNIFILIIFICWFWLGIYKQ